MERCCWRGEGRVSAPATCYRIIIISVALLNSGRYTFGLPYNPMASSKYLPLQLCTSSLLLEAYQGALFSETVHMMTIYRSITMIESP